MSCDLEPFVVVFNIVGGAKEIVELLVGELVLENFAGDLIDGRVGELKPAWVGEEFVEIFDLVLVDDEFFLGEEKGIDGGVEFLIEEVDRREHFFDIDVEVDFLSVEIVETFNDFWFCEVFDDVFDAVDKDGALGVVELFVAEGPDIAFFVADKDGDILPERRGSNGVVACDDVARKIVYKSFVFAVVKKIVELV